MELTITLILLGGFAVSMCTALALTPVVRRVARQRRWMDEPDPRKMHSTPTPQAGGIAIIAAFIAGLLYFAAIRPFLPQELAALILFPSGFVLGGAAIVAITGLYDDVKGMHFGTKFLLQLVAALLVVAGGHRIQGLIDPSAGAGLVLPDWMSVLATVAWIVAIVNAINLLDGMDGLASGVSVIVFGSLAAAYAVFGNLPSLVLVIVVVGALLGFLWYNFNPATIFMGDTGSLFIGFLLATYSLNRANHAHSLLALVIPILAMGLPLMDTGLAIVRRFVEKRPLFQADRDHIHHRMSLRLGLSHRNTVLVLYGLSVAFGTVAFLLALSGKELGDQYWGTIILVATSIGIFILLKVLGYLPSIRRSDLDLDSVQGDGSSTDVIPGVSEGDLEKKTKPSEVRLDT